MELIEIMTLAGLGLMSMSVIVGFGALLRRGGSRYDKIMGSLDAINVHLDTLNGTVATTEVRSIENAIDIARLEGPS